MSSSNIIEQLEEYSRKNITSQRSTPSAVALVREIYNKITNITTNVLYEKIKQNSITLQSSDTIKFTYLSHGRITITEANSLEKDTVIDLRCGIFYKKNIEDQITLEKNNKNLQVYNSMMFTLAGRLESDYKTFHKLLDKQLKNEQLEDESTEENFQMEEIQYRELELQESEKLLEEILTKNQPTKSKPNTVVINNSNNVEPIPKFSEETDCSQIIHLTYNYFQATDLETTKNQLIHKAPESMKEWIEEATTIEEITHLLRKLCKSEKSYSPAIPQQQNGETLKDYFQRFSKWKYNHKKFSPFKFLAEDKKTMFGIFATGAKRTEQSIIVNLNLNSLEEIMNNLEKFPNHTKTFHSSPQNKKKPLFKPKPDETQSKTESKTCKRCGFTHPGSEKTCFRTKDVKGQIINTSPTPEALKAKEKLNKKQDRRESHHLFLTGTKEQMHSSKTIPTTNLTAIIDCGGQNNFIHPSLLPKEAIITPQKNTIIQTYGEYQTTAITKLNCKFLETEQETEFIIFAEEQDVQILIGYPELKRRNISINFGQTENNRTPIEFPPIQSKTKPSSDPLKKHNIQFIQHPKFAKTRMSNFKGKTEKVQEKPKPTSKTGNYHKITYRCVTDHTFTTDGDSETRRQNSTGE